MPLQYSIESYTSRLQRNALSIFLFHGVIEQNKHSVRNYTNKHLNKDDFVNLLKSFKRHGTALSLDDVIDYHVNRIPYPPYAYAITFDDGFENNASIAAPILVDLNVPATLYVTTSFIASNSMSWIDRIEWAVEMKNRVSLKLPWNKDVKTAQKVVEKKALLDEIRTQVKTNADIDPDAFATNIQRQCNVAETWSGDDYLDKKMSWSQIQALNNSSLFTVGGHTHTHAIMSLISPEALSNEIDTSLHLLAEHAGVDPRHYSYPEGLEHCYSDKVIEALKARNIVCCPTAEDGVNANDTDLFLLKRIFVI